MLEASCMHCGDKDECSLCRFLLLAFKKIYIIPTLFVRLILQAAQTGHPGPVKMTHLVLVNSFLPFMSVLLLLVCKKKKISRSLMKQGVVQELVCFQRWNKEIRHQVFLIRPGGNDILPELSVGGSAALLYEAPNRIYCILVFVCVYVRSVCTAISQIPSFCYLWTLMHLCARLLITQHLWETSTNGAEKRRVREGVKTSSGTLDVNAKPPHLVETANVIERHRASELANSFIMTSISSGGKKSAVEFIDSWIIHPSSTP